MSIFFDRRTEIGTISSNRPGDVWTDWRGENERWLFVSAHDDDIVCGAGFTLLAGLRNQVSTFAAVMSNGRMGYCNTEQRPIVGDLRHEETRKSFEFLGMPLENLYHFNFNDGNLPLETGRQFAANEKDPNAIEGGTGMQNSLTWVLRRVCPTRVFLPNRADLHPDHRAVHEDLIISIFHAQGTIWPELGEPMPEIPKLYEYATYSDFVTPPTMRIRVSDDLVEKRLQGVAMYRSQTQIDLLVDVLRKAGGGEYLLEMDFDIIRPGKYDSIF